MTRRHDPRAHPLLLLAAVALALPACRQEPAPAPAEMARPVGVQELEPGPFTATISLLGVLAPGSSIPVVARATGAIAYPGRSDRGLRTGERVSAGETLAILEDETARLAVAEAELEAGREAAEAARTRRAHAQGVVPESLLQDAESRLRLAEARLASARVRASTLTLLAPRSGTLSVEQPIPAGSIVQAGIVIARVVGEGAMRVEAVAAAADRTALVPGLPARLSATGREAGVGRVAEIAPVVDPSGTVRVVLDVISWEDSPAPGEGVTVEAELPARTDALTVPLSAVTTSSSGAGVFVVEKVAEMMGPTHRARRRAVVLGRRAGDRVEILSGASDGDRVIVAGADVLGDGDAVSIDEPPAKQPG